MFKQKIASNQYGIIRYQPTLFKDEHGWFYFGWVITFAAGVLLAFVISVIQIAMTTDHTACNNYGKAADRHVKFVRTSFVSDVCLYQTKSGQWLDISNLVGISNGN